MSETTIETPVSSAINTLYTRMDALVEKLDEVVPALGELNLQVRTMMERCKPCREAVDRLSLVVFGNQTDEQPGLCSEMRDLRKVRWVGRKVAGAIYALLGAAACAVVGGLATKWMGI